MRDEEFLKKYEELLDKGYCDCNEMNCIDNNSPRRILNIVKDLQKENGALKEDIKFCLHSIKQEMELSKDSRTRSEMNDCYEILKGWVK